MLSFKVGSGWSSPDYATIALCWAAQAGIANDDITMLCKGHLGNSQRLNGAHTHNLFIYTDGAKYKGNNEDELATVNNLTVALTSPVFIYDLTVITTNRYLYAFTLNSDYLTAQRIVFDNQTDGLSAIVINGYYPNSLIEYFVARGGSDVITAGWARGTNLKNGVVHGGLDKGVEASASVNKLVLTNVLAFDNDNADFDTSNLTAIQCASEDNTAQLNGYSSDECVDFVNKGYTIKASSDLYPLNIGAFFEEQINVENYSATLAFSHAHSVDLTSTKKSINSITLSTNNKVTATGFKCAHSNLLNINTANFSLYGTKSTKNHINISQHSYNEISGFKASYSVVSSIHTTTFTVSGIANNLLKKIGRIEFNNNAQHSVIGTKSISSTISTQTENSTTLIGIKATFEQLNIHHSNTINVFSASNVTTALLRSITIEGKLYLLQIHCDIDNTLTIKGKL